MKRIINFYPFAKSKYLTQFFIELRDKDVFIEDCRTLVNLFIVNVLLCFERLSQGFDESVITFLQSKIKSILHIAKNKQIC